MKFASSVIAAFILAAFSLVDVVSTGPQEIVRMSVEGPFLLRLGPDVDPVRKTEEMWAFKKVGTNFTDRTETWLGMQSNSTSEKASGPRREISVMATCRICRTIGYRANENSHIA